MKEKPVKRATSVRLTPEAKRLIVALANKMGISQSAVLELAIRHLARKEKVGDEHKD